MDERSEPSDEGPEPSNEGPEPSDLLAEVSAEDDAQAVMDESADESEKLA